MSLIFCLAVLNYNVMNFTKGEEEGTCLCRKESKTEHTGIPLAPAGPEGPAGPCAP